MANTSVSDIVKAAGVAQGTFYLYFDSKDAIVLAVVERFVDEMITVLEDVAAAPADSAVDEFRALSSAMGELTALPGAADLSEFIHAPENRAIHDRLADRLTPCLVPVFQEVIQRGIAQGVFSVPDPAAATWFVLGGLQSTESRGVPVAELPAALAAATELALRVLGYVEAPE
ncbi:MAG: TetR/AcrR family transcriptional regulator [Thermoleophilia bacterium]|nr:TetR/AcrR family transcriptional regulator [Thermoleophilia bacterium]